ncbi:phage tail tape measure protein [Lactococcus lactis]|uniref:SLT domain-containing protein/phage-related minor tail protein n=2 Tax=Lactococcus lactis TaxID=1358 RepID=A0AAW5TRE6_9LACT|nr:phage tail tape measure protein [Lactococcus lactis]MCW2281423.1 SLT domain-containing protein/phage-related minor tail protein [Lactococcus lactis]MCW2282171.1 SLT domain-containing protein/phage-related minor tail protein [Lactococcus lactis]
MSADGTINIDILLNKKEEFLNDAKKIDEILKALGKNTGEQMDASFTNEAKTLETKAKNTKKVIDLTFEKPVEVEIKAEDTEVKNSSEKVKKKLDEIPNKKETKIDAETQNAQKNIEKLGKKVEESGQSFSKLKEIIAGTFVGMLAAKGVEKVTSSLSCWIEQIGAVQDAHIKLKNTLGLSEEQAKSYAAVTRGLFTSGYVDSIEDATDVVKTLNTQLKEMPSGDMARISRYATILRDQFDMDLNESLRGINSLMTNFGLSADEAFDYMIKGAQRGLDKTDELGDNLAEYGQIWSQAGFDVKNMFGILENGLKSGAYNLDKVNDFVKEFTISLNDGRIEENLNSFSDDTKQLFNQFKAGKATASDVFKSVISDLKNTQNQQEKLSTASTIWSALGEDNAMKVIESLGDVNDAYENVSGTAEKTAEETEKSFGVRFKSTIRQVEALLIPVGNKILDITEKYMPSFGEVSGKVFGGIWTSVDKVCSYLDSHKKNIVDIIDNGKKILGIVADTTWTVFKDILNLISGFLGDVNENGKKAQDPLQQIDDILTNLAKHKDEIERVTKIVLAMWATKKIFAFISAVKEAKKALMELKAVELITGDSGLLNFKGLKIGKGTNKATKGAEEVLEGAEAAKSLTKLGKVGEVAKGGLKTAGRGIAGLDVLFSLFELIGINKNNAGKKVGAATGSLGGTVAGGVAGATIGSAVPVIGTAVGGAIGAGLGALGGTALGKKLGGEIQQGLKKYGPTIKKTLGNFFTGKLGWEQSLGKSASSAVKTANKTISSFGKIISKKFEPVKKLLSSLGKNITSTFNSVQKNISKVIGSISKTLSSFGKTIKKTISPIVEVIIHIFRTAFWIIYGTIRLVFQGIEKIVKKFFKWVSPYISKALEGISKTLKSLIKIVQSIWDNIYNITHEVWNKICKIAKGIWENIKKFIVTPVKTAWKDVEGFFGKIFNIGKDIFGKLCDFVRDTWKAIKKNIIEPISEVLKPVEKVVSSIFDSVSTWFGKIWNTVSSVFGDIVKAATDLPKNIGNAISGGIDYILSSVKDIANTMIDWISKGVNGVLHGINWVLDKVHAPKDVKWKDWKPKKFAQGTKGKTSEGQFAIINDAPGADYQELVLHPDGKARVYEGRNRLTYLPKGSEVLEGSKTKDLLNILDIPKYKEGTGKGVLSTLWEQAKDIGENVMDFIDDPLSLLKGAVKKFVNFGNDLIDPYYTIAKGGVSHLINGVKDWFIDKIQSLVGSSGSFDGVMNGNGVYQYLVDIANQAISKFGMSGITSGYRPGDRYWHGKHQAIDIAYPASMNYSGKYFEPANWVFDNFADKVGYVITQGKVRDRSGQSGQPATGVWETWPDNDHYDHLHITGKLGTGEISKGASGSGAERWRGQVIKAANMVGFPTDKSHIDRIIAQIQTESGGNEKAVQGNIGDINNITGDLAKGLMQTISATFNAYKVPGHDNIFNGFDNILAALRYIMSRYGVGSGFFANIGMGHGYANGGWASIPSIFGEVPGEPEVAINPKRDTADELIIEAINARTKEAPHSLAAKISKVLQSAKQDMQSILPESSKIPTSSQSIASRYTTIKSNRNMEHDSDRAVNLLSEMLKATKEQTMALINQPAPMVDGHSFFKEGAAMIHQTQMTYQNSANRRRGIMNN